jgi:hypothetical protein
MIEPRFDWDKRRDSTIQERFDEWVQTWEGQQVYYNCLRRAKALYDRGWRHFGIKAIWEAARYDRALQVGPDAEGFKLSNDHHSRMARYMMARHDWLEGFFATRELRTP